MASEEDKWILDEICNGLGFLMAAGLPGRPGQYSRTREESTAAVRAAAKVWAMAVEKELQSWRKVLIINDEKKRLQRGFQRLLASCREWPAPADLLDEIIQGHRPDLRRLPEPPPSAEQQARGLAAIRKIQENLRMVG